MNQSRKRMGIGLAAVWLGAIFAPVFAQEDAPPGFRQEGVSEGEAPRQRKRPKGAAKTTVEVIEVRGTKKSEAESAFEVPVAVSAFSGEQLEARQVRSLESLTFSAPNVTLDTIGTTPGVANFEIRGLGVNSSIPSIDPTVGVFVDGMYLGVNYGVVFDTFDLESVEVLRGPQGLLFGRNVTGGAILMRTKRPGDDFHIDFKSGVERGLAYSVATGVEGPVVSDLLNARLSVMWRDDQGWFTNQVTGDDLGAAETFVARPVFVLTPTDDLDFTVIVEYGDLFGQGPPSQNRGRFDGFTIHIDEPGRVDADWQHTVFETNYAVPFGDGKITNIFGWRQVEQFGLNDIDAVPEFIFHASLLLDQDQFSNELRYSGKFFEELWGVTVGGYWFQQDILYRERREILGGAIDSSFGGDQDHKVYGVFTQNDFEVIDGLILTGGVRFTYEEKDVEIATFSTESPCGRLSRSCVFDFRDDDLWTNWTPKAGVQWWATDVTQLYGHWTQGVRSGGYNFRNTSPTAIPGPFDEELQNAFEVGSKTELADGRVRLGVAGFYNVVDDLQREINLPDPTTGVVQVIRNTADARIVGTEVDATALLLDNLALTSSFGFTEGDYTKIRFDLNGDGVVDDQDEELDLPRLAPYSFNFGATYDQDLPAWGLVTLRPNYSYRDSAAYTDNNRGVLPSGHVIDASLAYNPYDIGFNGRDVAVTFTVFGKNLLNETFWGGDTQLPPMIGPAVLGGTFSPLKPGRVVGFETRVFF